MQRHLLVELELALELGLHAQGLDSAQALPDPVPVPVVPDLSVGPVPPVAVQRLLVHLVLLPLQGPDSAVLVSIQVSARPAGCLSLPVAG